VDIMHRRLVERRREEILSNVPRKREKEFQQGKCRPFTPYADAGVGEGFGEGLCSDVARAACEAGVLRGLRERPRTCWLSRRYP